MKLIIQLFIIQSFIACNFSQHKKEDYKINRDARKLNDSAVYIALHLHEYEKAISLLDQATKIDSNYFQAFDNKFSFQRLIKPFDQNKILTILNNLNRIKPEDPRYYALIGILYYKMKKPSISDIYFKNAAIYYEKILDTTYAKNEYYGFFLQNQALNFIFIDKEVEGKKILKHIYEETKYQPFKEKINFFFKSSKKEILDSIGIE